MGQSRPTFILYLSFSHSNIKIAESLDGVFGIIIRGRRLVVADETTELLQPPQRTINSN